ncbi:MAG: DUF4349 domain-containing protein [Gaiellaceae bacterium]
MSQPDLNDPRFEGIVRELREKAPTAPEALRERVAETGRSPIGSPRTGLSGLGLRRGLALAAAGVIVVGVGAALVNGIAGSGGPGQREASGGGRDAAEPEQGQFQRTFPAARGGDSSAKTGALSALPPANRRLQDYEAEMRLRVDDPADLDRATKRAMRDTRSLGGFVASIDFGTTPEDEGDATLVLRVPVARVQEAVARYTELGTIVSQQVRIKDLQPQADRLARTIAQHERRIAQLVAKQRRSGLTVEEELELRSRRQALQELTPRRARLVREAGYATVTLGLTTQDAAEKREEPGAFRTFWDDASKILVTELIWLLYALVVAGPFILLAILALLAERARRRRSDDALLAHN